MTAHKIYICIQICSRLLHMSYIQNTIHKRYDTLWMMTRPYTSCYTLHQLILVNITLQLILGLVVQTWGNKVPHTLMWSFQCRILPLFLTVMEALFKLCPFGCVGIFLMQFGRLHTFHQWWWVSFYTTLEFYSHIVRREILHFLLWQLLLTFQI